MKLIFSNFGVKSSQPFPKADYYIDCRSIANPFHDAEVGYGTGDDIVVQEWVKQHTNMATYYDLMEEALTRLPIRRGPNFDKKPFEVCCLCAHGIHRSRAMKNILADKHKKIGTYEVEVE